MPPVERNALFCGMGGGYVIGTANAFRNFCRQIAQRAGVAVFVVDYCLAPEYPVPQALNDAERSIVTWQSRPLQTNWLEIRQVEDWRSP